MGSVSARICSSTRSRLTKLSCSVVFWVIAITMGATAIVALWVMEETYAPAILAKKTKRLQKETGNMELRSRMHIDLPPKELFIQGIVRPAKLMFLSPICAAMNLYMAVVYAILYLLFTTFTFVFEEHYGFSESTVGLVYVGAGIGMLLGLVVLGALSDPLMKRLAAKYSDGKIKPEYRLPLLMCGGPFVPAGLLLYGWTAQYHVSPSRAQHMAFATVATRATYADHHTDPMGGAVVRHVDRGYWADRCVHVY